MEIKIVIVVMEDFSYPLKSINDDYIVEVIMILQPGPIFKNGNLKLNMNQPIHILKGLTASKCYHC